MGRNNSEVDVINFYMPFIRDECKNSYKGLELEDRIEEGKAVLLEAMHTYKATYGCFKDFLFIQLHVFMKQKNNEAWCAKRLESRFSLDASLLPDKYNFTLLSCIEAPQYDDSVIDVKIFVSSLPPIVRTITILLINRYSIRSISNMLSIPMSNIQPILNYIKRRAIQYYGNKSYI